MAHVWIFGREPYPLAPVVLLSDEKCKLAQSAANLCMEMSQHGLQEIREDYPEQVGEALKCEDDLAGLSWVMVSLNNLHAIGVGSRKLRYHRASRLGLALAFCAERRVQVSPERLCLWQLVEDFKKAKVLGLQNVQEVEQEADTAEAQDRDLDEGPPVEEFVEVEVDVDVSVETGAMAKDPWYELPMWASCHATGSLPLTMSEVEDVRLRGNGFSRQEVHEIIARSEQNMLDLLKREKEETFDPARAQSRINLTYGRPWSRVVAGAPDTVREKLVGCGLQSCHLEIDERRLGLLTRKPVPFFRFTRTDGSVLCYRPGPTDGIFEEVGPEHQEEERHPSHHDSRDNLEMFKAFCALLRSDRSVPSSSSATSRGRRSRSRGHDRGRSSSGRWTSGSMRSREGETPWGWKWDDRWHGRGQEKSESEEWIDVKVEDEDGWESWSNSRSWERSSQSRNNKYLEKSKGSPEHLQSLCTELTQELGDTRDTPRLQSFQRRLLREAVQHNCWRIRDLDPSVCYLAEWHYGHLIEDIPLNDQRLRGGHAEISATFRHGPHKGQPVQTLINDLSTGKCKANLLAPLVAVKFAGFLLVVCGNRRWYAVREFAKKMPPWRNKASEYVRVIVHDFPGLRDIQNDQQRTVFTLKVIEAIDTENLGTSAKFH